MCEVLAMSRSCAEEMSLIDRLQARILVGSV
jgi:hypothetical protein